MALLVDSRAHFESRASENGVPNDLMVQLGNAGVRTLGHLAFATNRPGQDLMRRNLKSGVEM